MNNYEAAINGVKIVAKILNIPEPHISFFDSSELSNKEITLMYLFESDEIIFNDQWVEKSPWIEVIVTAFHETRCAYQGYCIKNRTYESNETIDIWQQEFTNYLQPTGKNNEQDDSDYLNQSIEIDAIAFVHKMMLEHFDVKTMIPKLIMIKLQKRI